MKTSCIDRASASIKLNDISAMELNRIRGVATGALDSLRELEHASSVDRDGGGGGGGGGDDGGGTSAHHSRLQSALEKRQRMR